MTTDKAAIEAGDVGAQGKGDVMPLYASIKKPAGWKEYEKKSIGELKRDGFDGIILPDPDGSKTVVIFEPTQVKSAVKNNGTFDPANADIRMAEGVDAAAKPNNTSSNGTPDTRPEAAANIGVLGSAIAANLGIPKWIFSALHPYDARVLPGDAALREVAQAFGSRIQGFDLSPRLLAADRKRFGFFSGVARAALSSSTAATLTARTSLCFGMSWDTSWPRKIPRGTSNSLMPFAPMLIRKSMRSSSNGLRRTRL